MVKLRKHKGLKIALHTIQIVQSNE